MSPALLAAVDSTSHVHLIIGSNPLAGARCARSLEVGAKPILIAPEEATLHYGLVKRIDDGEVQWLKRSFKEEDLTTLGRPEVDGAVDAVFVTAGGKQSLSNNTADESPVSIVTIKQVPKSRACAVGSESPSTLLMRPISALSPSCPRTPTAPCKSA